jgi:hypothetical protein
MLYIQDKVLILTALVVKMAQKSFRVGTNILRLSAREICPVSQPVFFSKYHLQAWDISIISNQTKQKIPVFPLNLQILINF